MSRRLTILAGVNWQNNGTWALTETGWVNTPSSVEQLTNGNFEGSFAGGLASGWTIFSSATPTQETTTVHGGLNSQKLVASAINQGMRQIYAYVTGTWYLFSPWVYVESGGAVRVATSNLTLKSTTTTGAWQNLLYLNRYGIFTGVDNYFATNAGAATFFVDDATLRALTLNTLFNVRVGATASCRPTITAGTQAGVVAKLNSISAPTDFIIAYHDGTSAKMDKCVAGTYTPLISTSATYAAGALIELRNPSGNIWQLWYNGVQVSTDQTISDASIISNTLAGGFSTYSGNTLADLS